MKTKNLKSATTAFVSSVLRPAALCGVLSLALSVRVQGQALPNYSQFHQTPLLVNPAMGALDNDFRVLFGHRQQHVDAGNNFTTQMLAASYPFFSERNGKTVRTSNIGLVGIQDRAGFGGVLEVTGFAANYAYNLTVSDKHRVGLGLQLGYFQRRIDPSKFTTGSQFDLGLGGYNSGLSLNEPIDQSSIGYPLVNGGATFFQEEENKVKYYVGLAMQNINQPKYEFYSANPANLPMQWQVNGGYNIVDNEKFNIEPNLRVTYLSNGFNQTNVGSLWRLKMGEGGTYGHVGLGTWYNLNGAFVGSLELQIPYFTVGLAYDFITNPLGTQVSNTRTTELIVGIRLDRSKPSTKDLAPPVVEEPAPVAPPAPPAPPKPVERPKVVEPTPAPVQPEPVQPEVLQPAVKEPVVKKRPASKGTRKAAPARKGTSKKRGTGYGKGKASAYVNKYGLTAAEARAMAAQPVFPFNTADITEEKKRALDAVAKVLQAHPNLRVRITGHTCNIGTDAANQQVGDLRAAVGKQYLIDKGIDASRIETENAKDSKPVASNDTREGRVRNRRIEFSIID